MEHPPSPQELFAYRAQDFVIAADGLLEYLCNPKFGQTVGDKISYEDVMSVINDAAELDTVEPDLYSAMETIDSMEAIAASDLLTEPWRHHWHRFHVALPLDESERHWLFHVHADLKAMDATAVMVDKLSHQEAKIVSAGIHKAVNGGELLQRWVRWRRESDEFEHEHTLGIARDALVGLVKLIKPDAELPASYLALQANPAD